MAMIETPGVLIETPQMAPGSHRAELLADVLSHVHLAGALYLKGQYASPWILESPASRDLVALLAPDTQRLIPFHTVRSGSAWIEAAGVRVEVRAGDLAVLPHAHLHQMGAGPATEVVPIATLLPPTPWTTIPICRVNGGGEETEIICGYFCGDDLLFNSFLRHLPPVFAVRPDGAAADLLQAAVRYVIEQPPGIPGKESHLSARLPELLLVEALRLYAQEADAATGWLAATGDLVVGRALKFIHDDPVHDWNADELARCAATSRSVLNERFRALLGQSPIRYLVEWRMQIAAGLLRTTNLKIVDIAERSGYASDTAFSRAFQRHLGMSPAQWRDSGSPIT